MEGAESKMEHPKTLHLLAKACASSGPEGWPPGLANGQLPLGLAESLK